MYFIIKLAGHSTSLPLCRSSKSNEKVIDECEICYRTIPSCSRYFFHILGRYVALEKNERRQQHEIAPTLKTTDRL